MMFVVAGATGKTGSAVANALLQRGEQVRVLVRSAQAAASWRAKGAEAALVSLDDATGLNRALRGARGLYTLIPEDPRALDFSAQRRAIVSALSAAVSASQVPHVVLLSAQAAGAPEPPGPGLELRLAERALATTGTTLTVLRASYFQENVLAALTPARALRVYPSFFGSPDFAVTTNATHDVGVLAAQRLLCPPARSETVDVLGPSYAIRELAQRLGEALGVSLRVVDVPAAQQADTLCRAGLSASHAQALAALFAAYRAGLVSPRARRSVHVHTRLEQLLPSLLAGGAHRLAEATV
jgi:uncharacterized protein YbjT (DUF2867 family)